MKELPSREEMHRIMKRHAESVLTVTMTDIAARPNPTRISHWFPVVAEMLPETMYPKTTIIPTGDLEDFYSVFDGKDSPTFKDLVTRLQAAAGELGYPVFLRNDMTSGKHVPGAPCIVHSPDAIGRGVFEIAEFEAMSFMQGVGNDVWCVREYLPVLASMRAFKAWSAKPGLPISRERRIIVRGGEVVDQFPYWPKKALNDATHMDGSALTPDEFAVRFENISHVYDHDLREISEWSEAIARALTGDWSVDWMYTATGWCLIDMAEADKSWIADDEDRDAWKTALQEVSS